MLNLFRTHKQKQLNKKIKLVFETMHKEFNHRQSSLDKSFARNKYKNPDVTKWYKFMTEGNELNIQALILSEELIKEGILK